MYPSSSLAGRHPVNRLPTAEAAERRAYRRPKLVRRFLRLERAILEPSEARTPPTAPAPVGKPPSKAEGILAALAGRFPPGSELTAVQIADAVGITQQLAQRVRAWAKSVDRWPYAYLPGGWQQRRHRQGGRS